LLRVIATDVWGIHLSKANEVMHPNMVFHYVIDGFGAPDEELAWDDVKKLKYS
jgi:hypothetical protein